MRDVDEAPVAPQETDAERSSLVMIVNCVPIVMSRRLSLMRRVLVRGGAGRVYNIQRINQLRGRGLR